MNSKMILKGILVFALGMPVFVSAQEANSWDAAATTSTTVTTETTPSVSTAPAVKADLSGYETQFQSGSSTQTLGRVLSWGGLILSTAGSASLNTSMMYGGTAAMLVGIPINGIGSGKMVDAVNKMDTKGNVEHRGWVPYGVGMALKIYGTYQMVQGIDDYNDAYYDDQEEEALKTVVQGAVFSLIGEIALYVSWYKFSASADDASNAHRYVKLGAAPLLMPTRDGNGIAQGMMLTANF